MSNDSIDDDRIDGPTLDKLAAGPAPDNLDAGRGAPSDDRDDPSSAAYELLALSAHELRAPVASIVGFAETIRDRRSHLSQQQFDDALDTIVRQAHRLDALLQDILLLAAGSAGLLHLRPGPVGLRDALLEVVNDEGLDPTSILVACDPDIEVFVDRRRLHQMVGNYLTNARIHGQAPYAIEVTCQGGVGGGISVAVRDAGPGVSATDQHQLFDRFHRGAAAPSVPGTGLGLAVVRTLAHASGGSAAYRPGPPGGHSFILQLPGVPAPTGGHPGDIRYG